MILHRLLNFAYRLLYGPFAVFYDLVAWWVSAGHWQDWVQTAAGQVRGTRVLELGFGPAHLQVAMQAEARQVFGLDLSRQMAQIGARRLRRMRIPLRLIRSDAGQIPFPSNSFDTVVSTFPAPYIFSESTLSEVARTLRPGGLFLLLVGTTPKSNSPLHWINVLASRVSKRPFDYPAILTSFSPLIQHGMLSSIQVIEHPSAILIYITSTKENKATS